MDVSSQEEEAVRARWRAEDVAHEGMMIEKDMDAEIARLSAHEVFRQACFDLSDRDLMDAIKQEIRARPRNDWRMLLELSHWLGQHADEIERRQRRAQNGGTG